MKIRRVDFWKTEEERANVEMQKQVQKFFPLQYNKIKIKMYRIQRQYKRIKNRRIEE